MSACQTPVPGDPCPKCDGAGGHFADAVPQWMGEWTECEACEGTGEFWPEDRVDYSEESP